jgi:predicted DNA-binding protein (MmcQ/YjbR family)
MNIEELREYALTKAYTEECFPFDQETLVFKVKGKIFMLVGLNNAPLQFNVKCDPEEAIQLRDQYDCIKPGYHMNKKHWNTVILDGSLPAPQLLKMIDHSYELVAIKGTK